MLYFKNQEKARESTAAKLKKLCTLCINYDYCLREFRMKRLLTQLTHKGNDCWQETDNNTSSINHGILIIVNLPYIILLMTKFLCDIGECKLFSYNIEISDLIVR